MNGCEASSEGSGSDPGCGWTGGNQLVKQDKPARKEGFVRGKAVYTGLVLPFFGGFEWGY